MMERNGLKHEFGQVENFPGTELCKALCNRDSVDLQGFIFTVESGKLVSLVCCSENFQEIASSKKGQNYLKILGISNSVIKYDWNNQRSLKSWVGRSSI